MKGLVFVALLFIISACLSALCKFVYGKIKCGDYFKKAKEKSGISPASKIYYVENAPKPKKKTRKTPTIALKGAIVNAEKTETP